MSLPQLEGAASPSGPWCGAVPRVGFGGSSGAQAQRGACPPRPAPGHRPLGRVPLFGQQAEGKGPAFLCGEATAVARPHVATHHSLAVRDFIHPGRGGRAAC